MMPSQEVFNYAEKMEFGKLYFKIDQKADFFAVIAVHNLQRGPAIGGCRWLAYPNINEGIYDALRLARGMTFKSAVSDLPHGGAKAVLIKRGEIKDRENYFRLYAEFVNELAGSYITAADSGTGASEMDIIAKYTPYVSSTSNIGNPAVLTARGVICGIKASVHYKLQRSSLENLHICIQGLGQVGYLVAQQCHALGARLTIADTKTELAEKYAKAFDAKVVPFANIHAIPCDVFSPCALGGILNPQTIPQLQTAIIAGAANNQLSSSQDGNALHQRQILYAPDYVINAGGVIQASGKYHGITDSVIDQKVEGIYHTLRVIFDRSSQLHTPTSDIADQLAIERLEQTPLSW